MAGHLIRDRALGLAVPGLLLAVLFISALAPVTSFDLWWHLRTGQLILEIGEVPRADPFTFTAMADDPLAPGRPAFILGQYWLAQVLYAKSYEASGLDAIILLRGLLYALIGLAVLWAVRALRASRGAYLPLVLMVMAASVALEDSDRPQVFSYLMAIATVMLVELSVSRGSRRLPYAFVPMMLLASNMHGGYAVSLGFMAVYAGCSLFEPRLRPLRAGLVSSAALGLAAAYLNPTHWQAFGEILARGAGQASLSPALEYRSPLSMFSFVRTQPGWLAYWALAVLSAPAGIYHLVRKEYSRGLLLLGTLLASLSAVRYIFFFVPVAAALSPVFIQEVIMVRLRERRALETAAACLALLAIFMGISHPNRLGIKSRLRPMHLPLQAAEFMAQSQLPPRVFNMMDWGGYLEWRLWPNYMMYSDTRNLFSSINMEYPEISAYTKKGMEALQRSGAGTVIMPPLNPYTAEMFPIVRALYLSPDWVLAYNDPVALVFASKEGYSGRALPKAGVYYSVLSAADYWEPAAPWLAPGYGALRAEAMRALGL